MGTITRNIEEFRDLCVKLEQPDGNEVREIWIVSERVVRRHENDPDDVYFGDDEARRLSDILRGNTTLSTLGFPITLLTVRGAACFMDFIANSPSLKCVSLDGIPDTFECPNQAIVADVLIRAAIKNRKGLLFSCGGPIGRSTLMVALGYNGTTNNANPTSPENGKSKQINIQHSFLAGFILSDSSILIIDDDNEHYSSWNDNDTPINNNNNLHHHLQPSFSNNIRHFHIERIVREDDEEEISEDDDDNDDDGSSRLMGGWLLRCASHFPHLQSLTIRHSHNDPPLPWNVLLSTKSNVLKSVRYKTPDVLPNCGIVEQSEAFCDFLKVSKTIEKLTFEMTRGPSDVGLKRSVLQRLADAMRVNRNITRVNVFARTDGVITSLADDPYYEIEQYCQRNTEFLNKLENGSIEIPPNLFPLAAAIAIKSQRGMTALFQQRLPYLFSLD